MTLAVGLQACDGVVLAGESYVGYVRPNGAEERLLERKILRANDRLFYCWAGFGGGADAAVAITVDQFDLVSLSQQLYEDASSRQLRAARLIKARRGTPADPESSKPNFLAAGGPIGTEPGLVHISAARLDCGHPGSVFLAGPWPDECRDLEAPATVVACERLALRILVIGIAQRPTVAAYPIELRTITASASWCQVYRRVEDLPLPEVIATKQLLEERP